MPNGTARETSSPGHRGSNLAHRLDKPGAEQIISRRLSRGQRDRDTEERLELAAHVYRKSKSEDKPFDLTPFGLVFSIEEIEKYWTVRKAKMGLEAMKPSSSAAAFRRPKAA